MLKILIKITILFSLMMTACDRTSYLEMYLDNSSNKMLYVIIKRGYDDDGEYKYHIPSNSKKLIAQSELIHRRQKSEIPILISSIEIMKDSIPIKINALDTNYWNFEIVSEDNIMKKTYFRAKATLVVYNKYFE